MVTAEDIGADEEATLEEAYEIHAKAESTPHTPHRSEKDATKSAASRSGRKSVKAHGEEKERARSGSAPAKRIVSDGHWKKKRSPPKSAGQSKSRDKTAAEISTRQKNRVEALPNVDLQATPSKAAGHSKERANVDYDGKPDPLTPSASHRKTSAQRLQKEVAVGGSQPSDEVQTPSEGSSAAGSMQGRNFRSSEQEQYLTPKPRTSSGRKRRSSALRSAYADSSLQPIKHAPSDGRISGKSPKGNILSQVFEDSRKAFSRQAPEAVPTPRVPSIEAWLNETPDPFVGSDEQSLEYVPPSKPLAEKRQSAAAISGSLARVEDPNKIWDALDTKEGTRRTVSAGKRQRRIPSSAIFKENPFPADFDSDTGVMPNCDQSTTSASKLIDLVQDSPYTSPSSLKRRSARKSVSSPIRNRQKSIANEDRHQSDKTTLVSPTNKTVSPVEGPLQNDSLALPGLNAKRPFPSIGRHRLSTIASVETFETKQSTSRRPFPKDTASTLVTPPIKEDETAYEAQDQFDPDSLEKTNSRLTKHADLISVLSMPKSSSRSIQSARSIRTNRTRLANATIEDLLRELTEDESKYMRELRTLVDGVIPVLLTCVLSKSDSAVAAGLFSPCAPSCEDPNFTKPIINMGIALERLKTLHKRIPQDNPSRFLTWAHGAQRVYAEYLKAWRMGFQDVVVNLAPAAQNRTAPNQPASGDTEGLDGGLPRDENGDIVNGDGERVDVAFLLKRPLVRLKYLQKTLKGINVINPSVEAELLAQKYQDLVDDARRRSNEERARLEDEAASNVDASRTRDPRTLAPLAGTMVNRTRRVRARDNFNLALQHSSGQCLDCRAELVLRDGASDAESGVGDVLLCEVDATGKWLLFPPIQLDYISARNGDHKGEIVIMIRGIGSNGNEWQEILILKSEDEQAGFEWVQMLGLLPVPPQITRSQSFLSKHTRRKSLASLGTENTAAPISPGKSRTPSPKEVQIPIGEHIDDAIKAWVSSPAESLVSTMDDSLLSSSPAKRQHNPPATPPRTLNYVDQVNDLRSLPSQKRVHESGPVGSIHRPRSFKEALGLGGTDATLGLKRARAKRLSKHGGSSPSSPVSRSKDGDFSKIVSEACPPNGSTKAGGNSPSRVQSSSPEVQENATSNVRDDRAAKPRNDIKQSKNQTRSSVPTMDLPYIPKARQNSPPTTPQYEPEQEPEWPTPEAQLPEAASPSKKKRADSPKSQPRAAGSSPASQGHHASIPVQLDDFKKPDLTRSQLKPRRSSSPLKHQYEPSTASDSSSDSDASTVEHHASTSVSDSSDDDELDEVDTPMPMLPLGAVRGIHNEKAAQRASLGSTLDGTIKPSESASQAPYKTVPPQPTKASKTIASIFSWSDSGSWQSLHPDECSIVITPGLIEAFEMSAAHSEGKPLSSPTPVADVDAFSEMASNLTDQRNEGFSDRPLVALELTPLVPLRRGTALDISIRSPPTSNSQITSGHNIMFRSRNPEECEALYALINHSRINNPTFIALQNARASGSSFGADRRASTAASGSRRSWFGGWGRASSYRASSAPTPSIAPSDSSVGTMSSAFSALKRFGGRSNGIFSISRSTIMSREGSRANSIYTSSDNSSGSGTSSPIPPGMATMGQDAPIGLSNAKIRLYARESASKWRDMGSARLTIMRPETSHTTTDGRPPSSGANPTSSEKRIVIHGKTKGEVLLDVQLGETCFERVARTGIAVSVWEDVTGPNGEVGVVGAVGGVSGGRATVYMLQVRYA